MDRLYYTLREVAEILRMGTAGAERTERLRLDPDGLTTHVAKSSLVG